MAKLTMGTDGALALQRTIQSELATRGYSSENDPVMAEYITIMVINDKTSEQINSELADLIGSEYESNFTDWLFAETAKAAAPADEPPPTPQPPSESRREDPPHLANRRTNTGPTPSLIQSALSGVHPPTGPSASRPIPTLPQPTSQKRTASARSPSPSSSSSQPNKARRTDAPTGPRAMMDRGAILDRPLQAGNQHQNGRSLIDRVGPHNRRGNLAGNGSLSPAQVSHIQAQIDGITGSTGPRHHMNGRGVGAVPPMNGGSAMNSPDVQQLLAMQTQFFAQMAATFGGAINPGLPGPPGFPQQNFGGFPQQQQQQQQQNGGFPPGGPGFGQGQRGRGGVGRGGAQGRGGMGGGRGRGGSPNQFAIPAQPQPQSPPAPTPAATSTSVPERPGTPSLCKYALKCTNPQCRYSHPSPVATVESGVVLSTEFCPKGKACKDKHCTLGHVSPSVVNGASQKPTPSHTPAPAAAPVPASSTPCKFGLACTRPGCMFTHPPNFRPPHQHHPHPAHHHQPATAVPCRFGASCTRGDCPFQHPKGHVSANMFYKGLGPDAPLVEGYVSPHKSVRFGTEPKGGASQPPVKEDKEQENEKKDEKEVEAVALGKDKVGEKTVGVGA